MKKLPIGMQDFKQIITGNYVYVDKTNYLYDLITQYGNRFFLSRPRRFGKSLACSTLEAIFQAKKELFKDLSISKTNYDWVSHPVIKLDFSGIAHQTINELHISISLTLDRIAYDNNVDISVATLPKDKFKMLITNIARRHGSVVIIIDEYDKPIIDHIFDKEKSIQMRDFLKSFYGVLKDASVETSLRFLFLTGVSKFSKTSIFSELNNLQDLTMDERAAMLCGYTQEELEASFDLHILDFAKYVGKTKQDLLVDLKTWYNGFKFSKYGFKVYNPFSILNCLMQRDFRNYWFSSGTPTFIIKFVERHPELVKKLIMLEAEELTINDFEKLSVEGYFENMLVTMQQAGYLTLARYNDKTRIFSLEYPNFEVRLSMTEQIFELVANLSSVKVATMEYRFKDALKRDNINDFCLTMKDFFTLLPHTIIIDREKFYQGVFFTVAKLIGADINAEEATSRGYIDAVLRGSKNIYVIEFKKGKTPDDALAQITDKEYFAKFKIEAKKPVILVGMNFDYTHETGVVINWKSQNLN